MLIYNKLFLKKIGFFEILLKYSLFYITAFYIAIYINK